MPELLVCFVNQNEVGIYRVGQKTGLFSEVVEF